MCSGSNYKHFLKSLYNVNASVHLSLTPANQSDLDLVRGQEFKFPLTFSMPEAENSAKKESDTKKYRDKLALHYSKLANGYHQCRQRSTRNSAHKSNLKKPDGGRNSTIALIDLKTGQETTNEQDGTNGDAQQKNYKKLKQKFKNKVKNKNKMDDKVDNDPDRDNWGLGRRFALQELDKSQYLKPMRFKYRQVKLFSALDILI